MKKRVLPLLLSAGVLLSSSSLYAFAADVVDETDPAAQELFVDETPEDAAYSEEEVYTEEAVPDDEILNEEVADETADIDSEIAEETTEDGVVEEQTTTDNAETTPGKWPAAPDFSSESIVLLEDSTNTVLYSKNENLSVQIGSPVKIMTVLVALENGKLDEVISATDTGVSAVYDESSNIDLKLGESLTLRDYLYAIMLGSANDASLQVAESIGGSVDNFVTMMNDKATALGCTHTKFVNPTGFTDDNQVTTAHDLALIIKAALDYDDFRTIASADSYTIPATDMSDERVLNNTFALLVPSNEYYYEGTIGGKEGYTEGSLNTLACGAEKDGMRLFAVLLKGDREVTDSETIRLLDYGFSNFHTVSAPGADTEKVILPVSASVDDLEISTTEKNDGTYSAYYYDGVSVGSSFQEVADIEASKLVDNSAALADNQTHRTAASDITINKSMTPYYIITIITIALLLSLLALLIKVIKS